MLTKEQIGFVRLAIAIGILPKPKTDCCYACEAFATHLCSGYPNCELSECLYEDAIPIESKH